MTTAPLLDLGPAPVRPADSQPVTGNRHRCADCRPLKPGSKLCHCSICHATFTTVRSFDAHQPSYTGCADPADVGLVPSTRSAGVWCRPGSEKEITR